MALIQMNMFSQTLMRQVPVTVVLPVDKLLAPGAPQREDKPYKTLYLLHGVLGNCTDWMVGTRVQRFAEEHDLVVVMPSGDNAFYLDYPKMHNFYGEFVGKELVEITRKMFPLSHEREDTFIGGLSMGGYGAMRNGLKYYENFGYIVSLSGALSVEELMMRENDAPEFYKCRDYIEGCFGNFDEVLESDKNPKYLVKKILEAGAVMPKIYIACGDKDELLAANKDFAAFLEENKVDLTFEIGSGDHEWDFWDTYIKKAIEWLPT